jgi:hypothetical protein
MSKQLAAGVLHTKATDVDDPTVQPRASTSEN